MFRVETHKNLSLGQTGECTRLVLRDKTGAVIFFALEMDDDHYIMGKKGDDGFEQVLQSFNLAKIEDESKNI